MVTEKKTTPSVPVKGKTEDAARTDEIPRPTTKVAKVEDGAAAKEETILTELEDYIKTASYLGTKVITPSMRKYVYRRRLDGLAILNTLLVDKKSDIHPSCFQNF